MTSVQGQLEAGEAYGTQDAIGVRQRGSTLVIWIALIVLGVLAAQLSEALGKAPWSFDNAPPAVRLALIGMRVVWVALGPLISIGILWIAFCAFSSRLITARYRKNMVERGLAVRFPHALEMSESGLELRSGGIVKTAGWQSVTEIFRVKGYWVFLVETEPWIAPARFFPTASDEKAFIRAALARVSGSARERSWSAAMFAAAD